MNYLSLRLLSRFSSYQKRTLFEVGSSINIKYMNDDPELKFLPDSEYPPWVLELHKPLPSKRELTKMVDEVGLEGLSTKHLKLLRRRMTLEKIKQSNLGG